MMQSHGVAEAPRPGAPAPFRAKVGGTMQPDGWASDVALKARRGGRGGRGPGLSHAACVEGTGGSARNSTTGLSERFTLAARWAAVLSAVSSRTPRGLLQSHRAHAAPAAGLAHHSGQTRPGLAAPTAALNLSLLCPEGSPGP